MNTFFILGGASNVHTFHILKIQHLSLGSSSTVEVKHDLVHTEYMDFMMSAKEDTM